MPVAELALSAASASDVEADVLVLGVAQGADGPAVVAAPAGFEAVTDALPALGATGAKDEVKRMPAPGGRATTLALVGLGAVDVDVDADVLRLAAGAAARSLVGVESIALALPAPDDERLLAVLEGAALGAYSYTEYRSVSLDTAKAPARRIVVLGDPASTEGDALVRRATATAQAVHLVRDLVNTPPSDLYPETFADRAVQEAGGLGVGVEVLDEEALREGGYGGVLGVGQGSSRGPRLVKVSYAPDAATGHVALVGKGITFDSGGLSLKPAASMVGMKFDMAGAATVLAVVLAAARLALPLRLTAWLCLAENMPSGTAARPNDVFRIRGGRTVEVLNTDAEGRLVMADGIVAAGEEDPDAIIDVATLTGAAIVAMGNRYVPVMGDDALVQEVVRSAGRVGEPFWPMPLPQELRALLDSDVADIANAKIGNTAGGMLLAGVFLREFVGETSEGGRIPWAHVDIAGAASNGAGGYGYTGKGATGVAVRTLLALVESRARARD